MARHGKNYRSAAEKVGEDGLSLDDAVALAKELAQIRLMKKRHPSYLN